MIVLRSLPAKPWSSWTVHLSLALLCVLPATLPALGGVAEDAEPSVGRKEIHFAFSKSMFLDVNENDARAAMRVYTRTIGDQNGIYVNGAPELLDGTNAIAKALQLKQADLLVLTTEEFLALENEGLEGPLLLSKVKQVCTEDYLLLAREDRALRRVEDLKGRSLVLSSDARASLAALWLDVLCRGNGLGPARQTLSRVTCALKATHVVLPVFFGKADACIITRNGWEIMCELNPQLKKQLRIVAVSPPVVPVVTCFRRGFTESLKQQIIRAEELSSTKPAYAQLMSLFKTEDVACESLSALESTRALVATHRRLCAPMDAVASGQESPAPASKEAPGK